MRTTIKGLRQQRPIDRNVRTAALVAMGAALAAATLAAAAAAGSAEWTPTKPVRMIVGFPPGGATDLVARMIAPKMGTGLGRQVIVDNRPGANGVISNELIARADPDGHLMGFGHIGTLVISPTIQKVPYDVHKDLAPIGLVVSLQNLIIVLRLAPPGCGERTERNLGFSP